MIEFNHPINIVAKRTGLSPHVIRIWEKRYGAVTPNRTGTNRRLYSESEIERLSLLAVLTQAGHSISTIAKLSTEQLKSLLSAGKSTGSTPSSSEAAPSNGHSKNQNGKPSVYLDECIEAVKALDSRALESVLSRASLSLGGQGMLQKVVAPLAQKIGELWRDGTITAAHEHFATAVLRISLGQTTKSFSTTEQAPVLVVATPAGQLHELGALLVGASAANVGWRVTYLGASLPAAEIAGAAVQNRARAVAVSLVYPEDDSRLEGELTRLRSLLPPEVPIIAGGRAVGAYRAALEKIEAFQIKDLADLCKSLDDLRKPSLN